jgi:trehalose 6-phosphate phosphatase
VEHATRLPAISSDTDPVSLFLDVDGTLLDYADRPDAVVVDAALVALLMALHRSLGGALALVSGRAVATLDALFHPFRGTAVGLHGIEVRRGSTGQLTRAEAPELPAVLRARLDAFVDDLPGGFLEDKTAAVALHHRLDDDAAELLHGRMQQACDALAPEWTVMKGRQVLEVKPAMVTKADGCDALLREPPFRGTWPIAFGDDVTDLDMFEAIKRHGGTTVSVGPRIAGVADLQVETPQASTMLLRRVLAAATDDARAARVLAQLRDAVRA